MDVHFRVAGEQTPAAVTGFGVVLSDVDVAGATLAESGMSVGTYLRVLADHEEAAGDAAARARRSRRPTPR